MNNYLKLSVISFNVLAAPFLTTHRVRNYFLLTWNLISRIKTIGKLLNESQADVLCLQEVHSYAAFQLLKRSLSKYGYSAYKPFIYGPRGGLVIFSKLPFTSTEYVDFLKHGSLRNKSITAKVSQNGILVAKIKGYPLYILNTYVTADTDHKWNEESKYDSLRALQINQLGYLVRTLSFMHHEIIVTGDLNITKGSELYNELIATSGLTDTFAAMKHYTQHGDYLPIEIEPQILDYILYTDYYHTVSPRMATQLFDKKMLLENNKKSYLSDHIALQSSLIYQFSHPTIEKPEVLNQEELKTLTKHSYLN